MEQSISNHNVEKYYYIRDSIAEKGFVKLNEEEFIVLFGDETIRPYASKVYFGNMTIEEVPEEPRESVRETVSNRIARFGKFENQQISSIEFQSMLEEVL